MSEYQLVLLAILVGLIALAIVVHLPPRRPESEDDASEVRDSADFANRDDERHWRGFIYNNPDDPNLFVPKRFGLGWTLNFGHPQGKVLIIGLLLVIVVLVISGPLLLPGSWGPTGFHPSGGGSLP